MEKDKLIVIRNEVVKYISEMELDSSFSIFDRFEIMRNLNNFLDPDNYEENIDVLNKCIK